MNPKCSSGCLIFVEFPTRKEKKMNTRYFILFLTVLILAGTTTLSTQSKAVTESPKFAEKGTGIYFEIEISSTGGAPIIWKNWRDGSNYRGESDLNGNPTITIVAADSTYSLSPKIKVARKTKIVRDEKKNPLAGKYGPLADIPQLDPVNYLATVRRLGAAEQGGTELAGVKAQLYNLKIQGAPGFPWDNFMFWIDKSTMLPLQIQYKEGTIVRTIKFLKIEKGIKVDQSMFTVPGDYKLVEFEWD